MAPIHRISPRARAGFSRLARSIPPVRPRPLPTRTCISSILQASAAGAVEMTGVPRCECRSRRFFPALIQQVRAFTRVFHTEQDPRAHHLNEIGCAHTDQMEPNTCAYKQVHNL